MGKFGNSGQYMRISYTSLLLLLLGNSLLDEKYKTCADLITNKKNSWDTEGSYTRGISGLYSTIEAIAGEYIDFHNIQFYNQGMTNYRNTSQLFSRSREGDNWGQFKYTSICEMNQFGHIPLDKIVVGRCSCDGCGATQESMKKCRGTPSSLAYDVYFGPEETRDMISGANLKEKLGGIMVWKYTEEGDLSNGYDFGKAIAENDGKSAFFSSSAGPTSDVPRYVVYIIGFGGKCFPSPTLDCWKSVFTKAKANGVNYLVLAFYTPNGPMDATNLWTHLSASDRKMLKSISPGTKLILSLGGANAGWDTLVNHKLALDTVKELVTHAKTFNYDGIDFDIEGFTVDNKEDVVCWLSFISYKVKDIWPEGIVSHAPQTLYLGPLVEKVTDVERAKIKELFSKDTWKGCYDLLGTEKLNPVPFPVENDYKRPTYKSNGMLAQSFFEIRGGKTPEIPTVTRTTSTSSSKTIPHTRSCDCSTKTKTKTKTCDCSTKTKTKTCDCSTKTKTCDCSGKSRVYV